MSKANMRNCIQCATEFKVKASRVAIGKGKFCSRSCRWQHENARNETPAAVEERFWSKVDKNGPIRYVELGPCWIWTGDSVNGPCEYGLFEFESKTQRAHRVAFVLSGKVIPEGLIVRHRCDNPPCVNPDHLLTGTQVENVGDAWARQRAKSPPVFRGQGNASSKLTDDLVRAIRARFADGETQTALGIEFQVNQTTISEIVRERTWRHLLPANSSDASQPFSAVERFPVDFRKSTSGRRGVRARVG